MKAVLELKEIKKLDLGADLAVVNLHLACPNSVNTGTFTIESTGISFNVIGDYDSSQLFMLADWLREVSVKNTKKEYPTTNLSEVVSFAKEMIKTNKKLKERVSLM